MNGVRERVLGLEHSDTLTSVSHLCSVLKRQGKYEEAEAIHRRVYLTFFFVRFRALACEARVTSKFLQVDLGGVLVLGNARDLEWRLLSDQ